jgi:hypothetical protein
MSDVSPPATRPGHVARSAERATSAQAFDRLRVTLDAVMSTPSLQRPRRAAPR